MQKRYFERFFNQRIVIVGVTGPPWSGLSVHISRVKDHLVKHNDVSLFDIRTRQEFLLSAFYQWSLWFRLVWWRPSVILHYTCFAQQDSTECITIARWKSLFKAKLIIVEHNQVPHMVYQKKLLEKYKWAIDEWIFIGTKLPVPSVREQIAASLVTESEFIPPDLTKATAIIRQYPLCVRTFMKVRSPLLIMSTTDVRPTMDSSFYGIDHVIAVMNILRLYYAHIGLIWGVGSTTDLVKFSAMVQCILRNGLDGYVYIFHNEQQLWPLFREAHLLWWPLSTHGSAIEEALLCKTPVVATNACARKEGVTTYDAQNAEDCVEKMLALLPRSGRRKNPSRPFEHRVLNI